MKYVFYKVHIGAPINDYVFDMCTNYQWVTLKKERNTEFIMEIEDLELLINKISDYTKALEYYAQNWADPSHEKCAFKARRALEKYK